MDNDSDDNGGRVDNDSEDNGGRVVDNDRIMVAE